MLDTGIKFQLNHQEVLKKQELLRSYKAETSANAEAFAKDVEIVRDLIVAANEDDRRDDVASLMDSLFAVIDRDADKVSATRIMSQQNHIYELEAKLAESVREQKNLAARSQQQAQQLRTIRECLGERAPVDGPEAAAVAALVATLAKAESEQSISKDLQCLRLYINALEEAADSILQNLGSNQETRASTLNTLRQELKAGIQEINTSFTDSTKVLEATQLATSSSSAEYASLCNKMDTMRQQHVALGQQLVARAKQFVFPVALALALRAVVWKHRSYAR